MNQSAASDFQPTNDVSTHPSTPETVADEFEPHWTPYATEEVRRQREHMARMYWQTFGR